MALKQKKRDEIAVQDTWNLEAVYKNREELHKDMEWVKENTGRLSFYKGKLNDPETIKECLVLSEEIERKLSKLGVFSHLRYNEDLTNNINQEDVLLSDNLMTEFQSASSFIAPELNGIGDEEFLKIMEDERLQSFRFVLKRLYDMRKHTLSADKEEAYASLAEIRSAGQSTYQIFNNAELKLPVIKDGEGNEKLLTNGTYRGYMESPDRVLRENAFRTLHDTYGKFGNTFASLLTTNMKSWNVDTVARRYKDPVEKALKVNDIPASVFYNSLDTIEKGLSSLKRYAELKKRILGLDELHMYDLYVPLTQGESRRYTFDEGVDLALKALKPMGEEYLSIFEQGIKDRWIDKYENEGKRSGAYSWGSYDTFPYISLNFDGRLDDVSTFVHEMGHSMHSYFTRKYQPYTYGDYSIFLAEVASTCNEKLLIHYLIENASSDEEKMLLINQELEIIRATVYRQLMFAKFEKIMHERLLNGEAMTAQAIDNVWLELNTEFYGGPTVIDDEIKHEWSRIPHFYNDFYVYQYATGFAAASSFARMILTEGKSAADRYIDKFLKAGSSKYPVDVLKDAGVDMTSPKPLMDTIADFDDLLDQLEKLLK